tara:strand:- start:1704 stop:2147 length:444 start_codon:yes stop_codon:yes gene_type:complete
MNSIKVNNLKMGIKSEYEIHSHLENYFGKLNNTDERFGKHFEFDFFNESVYVELKTRNVKHNQFPTLIFGENKLFKGDELLKANPNLRIFYLFRCIDGIYYWEHRSTNHTKGMIKRIDRGKVELSMCVHIKTYDLKKLDTILIKSSL